MMPEIPTSAIETPPVFDNVFWKIERTWLTTLVTNKQAATPPVVRLDSIVNFDVSP